MKIVECEMNWQVSAKEQAGRFHLHEAEIDQSEAMSPDTRQIKWPLYMRAASFGQSLKDKQRVDFYMDKMQQLAIERHPEAAHNQVRRHKTFLFLKWHATAFSFLVFMPN